MGRTPRYSEDDVRDAVGHARSHAHALRLLGLRPAGGNHDTIKRLIDRYGISTAHFDPHWAQRLALRRPARPLDEVLVDGSTYPRGHLKRRLLAAGLKTNACELCGQGEAWRGRSMALILDHINGRPLDNRLENLRIVCPNCAATFDTHCGRKNASHPARRTCDHCGEGFYPRRPDTRYCSRGCAGRGSTRRRGLQPSAWKVPHPPYEQLKREVAQSGFLATGRLYGVSDNAIRKWLRQYARYGDLAT